MKGKRDYVILALLVGCALRRQELASLDIETIQLGEGRWVLADLKGREDNSHGGNSRSGSSTASTRKANLIILTRDTDYGVTYEKESFIGDDLRHEFKERAGSRARIQLFNSITRALKELI